MIMGSAQPFDEQGVVDKVENARENHESRECWQGGRRTCLHVCYYKRVFRGDAVKECAVLKKRSLKVRQVFIRKALTVRLMELEKQKWSDVPELARTIAELKKTLRGAEKRIARDDPDVRENGRGMKRRATKRKSSIF